MRDPVSVYARCVAGQESAFEQFVVACVERCLWMRPEDQEAMREVWAAHCGLRIDGQVDVARMADHLLRLMQRADEEGDERWRWVYERWYGWVCLVQCGARYPLVLNADVIAALEAGVGEVGRE